MENNIQRETHRCLGIKCKKMIPKNLFFCKKCAKIKDITKVHGRQFSFNPDGRRVAKEQPVDN